MFCMRYIIHYYDCKYVFSFIHGHIGYDVAGKFKGPEPEGADLSLSNAPLWRHVRILV